MTITETTKPSERTFRLDVTREELATIRTSLYLSPHFNTDAAVTRIYESLRLFMDS